MKDKRVTIYDIAKELKVSPSTVTRALNGRKGVSEQSRAVIMDKAAEMGYKTNLIAKSLIRDKIRIAMIVNDRTEGFHSAVIEGAKIAEKELADFNVEGEFILLPCVNLRNIIISEMHRLAEEGVDGIVFVPNAQTEFDEIVRELADKKIAIGTVILRYDNPNVAFSVFPDSIKAGKMAADLFHMSGLKSGDEVLIMLGFSALANHHDCVEGFRIENERYGYIYNVIQHYDNEATAYTLAYNYILETPTIKGIYCSTGVTSPVCKAVCDLGRTDIKIIGTEITADTEMYLEQEVLMATLFQDPIQQGRKAFRAMYEYLEGDRVAAKRNISINPKIVVPGNIDFYGKFIKEMNRKQSGE